MPALKLDRFLQQSSNIFAENRLLKVGFVAVTVVMLLQSFRLATIDDTVRERIIPVGAAGDLTISGSTASDDYLASMARYIVYMLGNYHAGTIRAQLNELLRLYHPTSYSATRESFNAVAERAERYASVSFALQWDTGTPIAITDSTIELRAVRLRIVGNSVPRKEPVRFKIHFVIEHGRFWIRSVEEAAG